MIWVWAILACLISFVLFKIKRIKPIHYIWIFLPIDYYGIEIGGFLIKPYMFFFLIILAYSLIKNRQVFFEIENRILILFFFVFLICDIGSGFIAQSVSQHILFIALLAFSLIYSSYFKNGDKKDFLNAIICSSIGFGVVNLIAIIASLTNTQIPGLFSETNSIIRTYVSMDTASYRLCGFEGDPNAFCIFYIIAFVISSYLFLRKRQNLYILIPAILLSFISIVFSKSRAALLLAVISFLVITIMQFTAMLDQKRYILIGTLGVFLVGSVIFFIFKSDYLFELFVEVTDSQNRAGLFDTFGRVSIWVENFKNMLIINPVFGVGSNQSYLYSSVSRACHNTWVEFFCSLGLIFGPIIVCTFFYPIFRQNIDIENRILRIAFIFLMLLLLTIDYIANIYLLIIFATLYKCDNTMVFKTIRI